MSSPHVALRMAALVAAPLLALSAVVAPSAVAAVSSGPTGAPADTCETLDLADEATIVARAGKVDAVYAGRVDGRQPRVKQGAKIDPATGQPADPADVEIQHRVTVVRAFSGEVRTGEKVVVVFQPSKAGKQRTLQRGQTFLFFTTNDMDVERADYCDGSVELGRNIDNATAVRLSSYLTKPEPVPTATWTESDGAGTPPRLTRVVAPGAALGLLGLLGLVLVGRLDRPKRR